MDSNEYIAKIIYEGDESYRFSNASVRLIVNKLNTEITANNITTIYNITKELVIRLKDVNGDPVSGVELTVDLNGMNNYTTDDNGQAIVEIKGLIPNNYTAKITFEGNGNYNKASTESDIEILKIPSILNGTDMTVNYKEDKYLTVSLKDKDNKPIHNASISVELEGIKNYTTNSDGQIKVPTSSLPAKNHTAMIRFEGNEIYEKSNATAKITVNKISGKLTASNVTARYGDNQNLVISLKDSKKNPLSGFKVSVDLNGKKNYTTDSSGQIKVSTKDLVPDT